jgi:hypothetical protein
MSICSASTNILTQGLLTLISASGFADSGINVIIDNDTTKELRVNVYDLNTYPTLRVVSSQTINSFASIYVTITADDFGQGDLSWTATTVDQSMRMCGRHDRVHVNDGDTVGVSARSECALH